MNPPGGSFAGDASNPSYQNFLAKKFLSSSFGQKLHARPAPGQLSLQMHQQAQPPYVPGVYPDYQHQYQYQTAYAQYYAQPAQQSEAQEAKREDDQDHDLENEKRKRADEHEDDEEDAEDEEEGQSKGDSQTDEGGTERREEASESQGEQARSGEEGAEKSEPEASDSRGEQKTEQATAPSTGIEDVLFWSKAYDPNTGHYYYYNSKTRVSQWEKPEGFVETDAPPPPPAWAELSSTVSADYVVHATFNKLTGRFSHSGTGSYFEHVGRAPDREGRQMSAFFDMSQLERNREEARRKKQELLSSSIDWRKYKEEKKKKRQKIQNKWLYDES